MINRARVRPSRGASVVGLLGSLLFVGIGVFFAIPNLKESGDAVWIGVVWTLIAVGGVIYNGINAFSDRGIASEEIQYDSDASALPASERLIELENLKQKNLISTEEYERKRIRIIDEI